MDALDQGARRTIDTCVTPGFVAACVVASFGISGVVK